MPNYFSAPGMVANADLSAKQYHVVQVSTTDWKVAAITNANAPQSPLGILQNDPDADGKPADVAILGICKAECGDTVTAGDVISFNNDGEIITDAETTTSSDLYHLGIALEDGVDGEIITVALLHYGLQGVE